MVYYKQGGWDWIAKDDENQNYRAQEDSQDPGRKNHLDCD